jgi:hypothetical protein
MNKQENHSCIKFVFNDSKVISFTNVSFKEAIIKILKQNVFDQEPLKVVLPSSKILYFDKQLFTFYINGEIEQPELINLTQCDGLYRNKVKLLTNTHDEIDAGTLWKRHDDRLNMVSMDEYIPCEYVENLFYEV